MQLGCFATHSKTGSYAIAASALTDTQGVVRMSDHFHQAVVQRSDRQNWFSAACSADQCLHVQLLHSSTLASPFDDSEAKL